MGKKTDIEFLVNICQFLDTEKVDTEMKSIFVRWCTAQTSVWFWWNLVCGHILATSIGDFFFVWQVTKGKSCDF